MRTLLVIILFTLIGCNQIISTKSDVVKPRTIVTTDGEVDDFNSFIRFLLYSNEFDIEGLIYSSSQWHYAGDGKGTLFTSEMPGTARRYGERTDLRWPGTEWMEEFIGLYAEVHDNLLQHDPSYPKPELLKSLIRIGNIEFEGEMEKITEGSEFIKEILLDNKPGPVYVQIWGGTNTLARALKSIEEMYKGTVQWDDIYKKVSKKTVIYTILDQDATYKKYIEPNWPEIMVIYNSAQFWSFAYSWTRAVPKELQAYLDGNWHANNIKFDRGPLLARYYVWGDGQQIEGDPEHTQGDPEQAKNRSRMQYDFISEGDSPSFFYLLDWGLRSQENPSYGGIGGRFVPSETNPFRLEDGPGAMDFNPYTEEMDRSYPQVRWIPVLQNDFAARAAWCVKDYEEANHAPVVNLKHSADITASPGDKVQLNGSARDPNGGQLFYSWWQYVEAGTYKNPILINSPDSKKASFTVPNDAKSGETIHIILEVTNSGTPPLTRFQRVILKVK